MISIGWRVRGSLRGITDMVKWVLPDGVKRCLCGHDEVLWVQEDFELHLTKGKIVIPDLIFQRCNRCHETYLGHKAMKRIEKATEWTRAK